MNGHPHYCAFWSDGGCDCAPEPDGPDVASLLGSLTIADAAALFDWVTQQSPDDDDARASVLRQIAFCVRVSTALQAQGEAVR